MDEQIEKLLRELAEKLGTTAEHLWGVLMRQAPISGVIGILVFVLNWWRVDFADGVLGPEDFWSGS